MTVCTILFPRTKLCFILFISFFYRWRTLISLASTLSLSVVTTKWTSVEMWSLRRNSSSTSRFDYECVVFYFKLCMWKCNLKFTKKKKKQACAVYFQFPFVHVLYCVLGALVPRWQPRFSHPHCQSGPSILLLSTFTADDEWGTLKWENVVGSWFWIFPSNYFIT